MSGCRSYTPKSDRLRAALGVRTDKQRFQGVDNVSWLLQERVYKGTPTTKTCCQGQRKLVKNVLILVVVSKLDALGLAKQE